MIRNIFGTTPTTRVFFNIRVDTGDVLPVADWEMPVNSATHVIPGAFPPRSELEIISFDPSVVTWRIWLASRADYRKLRVLLGTVDTLYLIRNLQSQGDTTEQILGVQYDVLPETTLLGLSRPAFSVDDRNGCEVDVTFQRHIDPETGVSV